MVEAAEQVGPRTETEAIEDALEAEDAQAHIEDEGQEPEPDQTPEEAPEPEGEPEFVEIEFNGEHYSVPPELKDALMRQDDYTRKTTDLASQRKAVELQQQEIATFNLERQLEQAVQGEIDHLKMLDTYMEHVKKNTNWSELGNDEILRVRMELDQLKDQRDDLSKVIDARRSEAKRQIEEHRSTIRKESDELLGKTIPSWSEGLSKDIREYVGRAGYPEPALSNMSALDYQIAWKAMQFDRIQAEKAGTLKKAAQTQTIKPTSRKTPMTDKVKSKLAYKRRLKQAGDDPRARENAILAYLEEGVG